MVISSHEFHILFDYFDKIGEHNLFVIFGVCTALWAAARSMVAGSILYLKYSSMNYAEISLCLPL